MKIESLTLQRFIDQFFNPYEPHLWRCYDRPFPTLRRAQEVAEWYQNKVPYAIAVYRCSGIKFWDRFEEPYECQVVLIQIKKELRQGVG